MQIYREANEYKGFSNYYKDAEVNSNESKSRYPNRTSEKNSNIVGATGLMVAAILFMIADMTLHGTIIAGLFIAAAIVVAFPKYSNNLFSSNNKWRVKYKLNLLTILYLFMSVVFILDLTAAPANAQFFRDAESWMGGAFEGIDETVVELFFNVLRAMFLLYLGISMIRVIQAARQDEDWQNLARTPLIIVVAVVAADIITGMIVGGGGGGAPAP
ncbi:MAG: hypothetical protein AAF063_24560 [Cyanobacteria bacterium J06643_5]